MLVGGLRSWAAVVGAIVGCGPPAAVDIAGEVGTTSTTSTTGTTGDDVDASSSGTTGPLLCDGPQGASAVVWFDVCGGESCTDFVESPWPAEPFESLRRVTLACTVDSTKQAYDSMVTRLDGCTGDAMPPAVVVKVPLSVTEPLAVSVGDRVEVQYERTTDSLHRVVEAWRLRDADGRLLALRVTGDDLPGSLFTAPLVFVPGPALCLIEEGYCSGLVSQGAVIAMLDGVEVTLGSDRETIVATDGAGWMLASNSQFHLDHLCGAWGTYWRLSLSALATPAG